MRNTLLVLHIIGAGTWLGGNVTKFVVGPRFQKEGGERAASWLRATVEMARKLYMPAAILILITGVWMVLDSGVYEFENLFVAIGIGMVIIGAALGMVVFGPSGEKAATLYESNAPESDIAPVRNRLIGFGALDTVLLVFTIVAMVGRWGV